MFYVPRTRRPVRCGGRNSIILKSDNASDSAIVVFDTYDILHFEYISLEVMEPIVHIPVHTGAVFPSIFISNYNNRLQTHDEICVFSSHRAHFLAL